MAGAKWLWFSAGWKTGVFYSLQFIFNRRKIGRYCFLSFTELAGTKCPARLRLTVINHDGVQFQFLISLRRIQK